MTNGPIFWKGLGAGFMIAFVVLIAALIVASDSPEHDATKMLQLRSACLATDTNITSKWCDDYAERFSRVRR